jgi:hypothetical protein
VLTVALDDGVELVGPAITLVPETFSQFEEDGAGWGGMLRRRLGGMWTCHRFPLACLCDSTKVGEIAWEGERE